MTSKNEYLLLILFRIEWKEFLRKKMLRCSKHCKLFGLFLWNKQSWVQIGTKIFEINLILLKLS